MILASAQPTALAQNFPGIMSNDLMHSQERGLQCRATVNERMGQVKKGMVQSVQTLEQQGKKLALLEVQNQEGQTANDAARKAALNVIEGLKQELITVRSDLASQAKQASERAQAIQQENEASAQAALPLVQSLNQQLQNLEARDISQAQERAKRRQAVQQDRLVALNALTAQVQADRIEIQTLKTDIGSLEREIRRIKNPNLPPRPSGTYDSSIFKRPRRSSG
jgi:hypothetical protein